MVDSPHDRDRIVTADEIGMTDDEVRRRWPDAVEYTALDGGPCWREVELRDRESEEGRQS